MDDSLPAIIDLIGLADKGARLQGDLPLAALHRLMQCGVEGQGTVAVDLRFGRDAEGHRRLQGRLDTVLRLPCQRCLQGLSLTLALTPDLVLIAAGERENAVPEGTDTLAVDAPVPLSQIVEDELILALPMMPMHPKGACEPMVTKDQAVETRPNPFAALAKLKQQHK
jgi:uncharacterized protein